MDISGSTWEEIMKNDSDVVGSRRKKRKKWVPNPET
jgi:hypothetical protein